MLSFLPPTPLEMMDALKTKFRQRRKVLGYTQTELSQRSGQIALESLLKLTFVLECLGDFSSLCEVEEERFGSMDEVLESVK